MKNKNKSDRQKTFGFQKLAVLMALLIWGSSLMTFAAKVDKPRFYFKIMGIGTTADAGHYGDFLDLNELYFTDLNANDPAYTVSFDLPKANFMGYGGEFGFETSKFSVGFSAGFYEKVFHSELHYTGDDGLVVDYTRDQKFSAIPLFLFFRYKVIDTNFFTGSLTLGEGVYLTTYKDVREETYENYDVSFANMVTEANRNNLGFHIGVTLDFHITRNIALSVDGGYRIAKFKEVKAEYLYEDDEGIADPVEDDLYFWENTKDGEARFVLGPSDEKLIYWESLPAEFDLSGLHFSIGLKITFGSGKKKETVKIAPQEW